MKQAIISFASFFFLCLLFFVDASSLNEQDFLANLPEEVREGIENKNINFGSLLQQPEISEEDNSYPRGEIQAIQERLQEEEWVGVLVWLKDTALTSPSYQEDLEKKKAAIQEAQDAVLHELPDAEFQVKYRYLVTNGFAGSLSKAGFETLSRHPSVRAIYLDTPVSLSLVESRPLVRADAVETLGITGKGVGVCVIDTGVDYTHRDLGGCFGPGCRVVMGYDFCNGPGCTGASDPDPMDENGHGTHVAGIVASSHAQYRGMAPSVHLGALKVFDSEGNSNSSAIAAGIDFCTAYASQFNMKIITMSLGDGRGYTSANCPATYNPALQNAIEAGIFIDASSGNEGRSTGVSYPACYKGVTAVGATYDANVGSQTSCILSLGGFCLAECTDQRTAADMLTCFTSRGLNLDVLAPGARINSTASSQGSNCGAPSSNGIGDCSGTSMSAPHVAGIAAALLSLNPTLKPAQLDHLLKLTGKPVFDSNTSLTFPRADALSAVRFAANPEHWFDDKRVTEHPNQSHNPVVAVDSKRNVHVIWQDDRDGNLEIYYKKLNRLGEPITADKRLTFNPSSSYNPKIVLDKNDFIHLVWLDIGGSYYKKLDNNGVSVTPDVLVTKSQETPSLAVDSKNNVHLAWSGLFYKRLDTRGINLTGEIRILQSYGERLNSPYIDVDSNDNIHLVFYYYRYPSPDRIEYVPLDQNGINLTNPVVLVVNGDLYGNINFHDALTDGQGNIHVLVAQNGCCGGGSLGYSKFNKTGGLLFGNGLDGWGGYFPKPAYNGQILTDSKEDIHLLWAKQEESPPTNGEIFYKKLNSSGSILADRTRLTFDNNNSALPSLGADIQNNAHVAWMENRDGNPEIYYKRSYTPLTVDGVPQRSNTLNFFLFNPRAANQTYLFAMALDKSPGIKFQGYDIPLNGDVLLSASLEYAGVLGLQNAPSGVLNADGSAIVSWTIPWWFPSWTVHAAFLTLNDEGFITSVSPAVPITVQS